MRGAPQISVVMPALNEEGNVGAAIDNTLRAFDDLKLAGELIVVDDGSTDNTAGVIAELAGDPALAGVVWHDQLVALEQRLQAWPRDQLVTGHGAIQLGAKQIRIHQAGLLAIPVGADAWLPYFKALKITLNTSQGHFQWRTPPSWGPRDAPAAPA